MSSDEKKNYLYNIIYRLSICLLPLIVTPYISRILGAERVGIYSFTSTVACYFIMFGKLGLDNYGNRCIASCKDDLEKRNKIFWGIYLIQIVTSLLSIAAYILFVTTIITENKGIYWLQLPYVVSVLFDVSWFFYGIERFRITTIRSLISKALIIIFVFAFVHSEQDLWIYTTIMSACFLLEQLQFLPLLFRYLKKVSLKKEEILVHILPNLKLFVPILAFSMFHWMDKIMLGLLVKSSAVVAFYTYAENIINLPKGIISALDTVMLPRISHMLANHQVSESLQKIKDNLKLNHFICCALCFGIAGVAPNFVPWFLGSEYQPTTLLTMELAIVMIPMSIATVIQTQYLIPFHLEHIYLRAVFLGAVVNTVLNLALIPFYGASGAVIGTILAEISVCAYQLFHVRASFPFIPIIKSMLPFIVCGILEFIVTYAIGRLPLHTLTLLLIQILSGGFVYLAACVVYLVFISKEYRKISDIMRLLKL
jgi:O-antigen/teichoic acid export membrane protein